ncbi:MAG: Fe-S-cluster-containing hydrogenase subunit [Bacillales bacterium]|jgi:Fe-S-cluster-containing dehydrogenase component|nr:Fe-S-cluster-containing hydrogenase subunit [Bacillales bacterium]
MSNGINRREFLKRSTAAGIASVLTLTVGNEIAKAESELSNKATIIDLTKCDGCVNLGTPACVTACSKKNSDKFPVVNEELLKPYWPQPKFEDHSKNKDITDRLTPYNWTFVDKVEVDGEIISIPRRCMHCDNATCLGMCPFGAIEKENSGAVCINDELCFGGAKCRDVCPWSIPQRQAGVGIYTKIAPEYIGGGVMYKCDFCSDLLKNGQKPACVTSCPKNAIIFGEKEELRKKVYELAKEMNGFVYGDKENGGTSTFYLSKIPFEKINDQLKKQNTSPEGPIMGRPLMEPEIENKLDTVTGMAISAAIAPIAGIITAGYVASKRLKGEKTDGK